MRKLIPVWAAVIAGFALGLAAGLTRAPTFTVYEFVPESVSPSVIPAVIATTPGYTMRWCSDGQIWPARSDRQLLDGGQA